VDLRKHKYPWSPAVYICAPYSAPLMAEMLGFPLTVSILRCTDLGSYTVLCRRWASCSIKKFLLKHVFKQNKKDTLFYNTRYRNCRRHYKLCRRSGSVEPYLIFGPTDCVSEPQPWACNTSSIYFFLSVFSQPKRLREDGSQWVASESANSMLFSLTAKLEIT
jgi:hypothetical protein